MDEECRCVPEPEEDNEPRGDYDAQQMLEAQERSGQTITLPEQPPIDNEFDNNTAQIMEPQSQPVRICSLLFVFLVTVAHCKYVGCVRLCTIRAHLHFYHCYNYILPK